MARRTSRSAGSTGCAVLNPVGNDGRFLPDTALVAGLKVEEANRSSSLRPANGQLLHEEPLRHSYPHCWRHKTPVVFRTTPQWFISMDSRRLRAHTLRDIKGVKWTPAWGEQRIAGMIADAPGLVHLAPAHLGRADRAVRAQAHRRAASAHPGTDRGGGRARRGRWHRGLVLPWSRRSCSGAEADDYDKVKDVMDVWADSGMSFDFVGTERPEVRDAR